MSTTKQMTHFSKGLKAQAIMLLVASVGGTINTKNEDEVKKLIERMCHNQYRLESYRTINPKGVLE